MAHAQPIVNIDCAICSCARSTSPQNAMPDWYSASTFSWFMRASASSLVARKLATVRVVTIAAPDYLARRGVPKAPGDLPKHDLIIDLNLRDPSVWTFGRGAKRADVRVAGRVRFSNPYMCVAAARSGFGIARVPDFTAAPDLRKRGVVSVLSKFEPDSAAVYAVYPHARHLASKVRVFVDFLAHRFAGEPEWQQGWN